MGKGQARWTILVLLAGSMELGQAGKDNERWTEAAEYDHAWEKSAPKFPTYDSMKMAQPKNRVKPTREDATEEGDALLSDMQKAVNTARRAEQRLQRLLRDRQAHKEQWEIYNQKAKQAFITEKNRYLKAVSHNAKEIEQAQAAQQEARDLICMIADGVAPPAHVANAEQDLEWDRMVVDWENERQHSTDGVVQRALQERKERLIEQRRQLEKLQGTGSGSGGAPAERPRDGTDKTGNMPTYGVASPSPSTRRSAPYPPTSPVLGKPDPMPPVEPSLSPQHPSMREAATAKTRAGIKETSKKSPARPLTGSTPLQEKLEERRAKERLGPALQPFRNGQGGADQETAMARDGPPAEPAQAPVSSILEDDDEDLEPKPPPGLSGLE